MPIYRIKGKITLSNKLPLRRESFFGECVFKTKKQGEGIYSEGGTRAYYDLDTKWWYNFKVNGKMYCVSYGSDTKRFFYYGASREEIKIAIKKAKTKLGQLL